MRVESVQSINKCYRDLVVIPLFENNAKQTDILKDFGDKIYTHVDKVIKTGDFKGKSGSLINIYFPDDSIKRVMFVGAGKKKDFNLEKLRKLIAGIDNAVQSLNIRGYSILLKGLMPLPSDAYNVGKACAESLILSRIEFDQLKSEKEKSKKYFGVVFYGAAKGAFQKGINDGKIVALNVNIAREIINLPSNVITPVELANRAQKICDETPGLRCTIFDETKLAELKMDAILYVAKGSVNPPRLVIIEYDGTDLNKSENPVILVGKGVTFDSGGISIKPAGGMEKMKYDMSGAAAVIGIMKSVAQLKLPLKVVGIVPAVENMPSGTAYKPGDVVTMASGLTVEVISTDAEGRMILADALHYGRTNYKPQAMIDMATLTGACVVALGNKAIGLMGNNRQLIKKFIQLSENSGERVWELPMWEDYDDGIKSDVADIKNVGGPGAGTIIGGVFLKKFVKNVPWIHLDIASTAWFDNSEKGYFSKGPTGASIRLLCEVLKKWDSQ